MNIAKIQEIVNNELLSGDAKKSLIINEIANSDNVIPTIMLILESERKLKKQLTLDINLLLSKAHIMLEESKLNKDGFMQKEIAEFYRQKRIGHCFKNMEK